MTSRRRHILQVALSVPLRRTFDYVAEDTLQETQLAAGIRVKVPFGKSSTRTGVVLGISGNSDLPTGKLKHILSPIDKEPLFSPTEFKLLRWASNYYHHPVGEVIFNALPALLRQGRPAGRKQEYVYRLAPDKTETDYDSLKSAFVQREIIDLLKSRPEGIARQYFSDKRWSAPLNALLRKGYISRHEAVLDPELVPVAQPGFTLNPEQSKAIDKIIEKSDEYGCYLLEGVTGSGKTEVYIETINHFIKQGLQSLVLVPEIGLTPQLANIFKSKLGARTIILHSGLSDGERLQAWLQARDGLAMVVLGTRSAIWTPLKNPGVIIIDEEHDMSYKQTDGLRYSARDVAIVRGKMSNIPVVLGSATPALESLYNAVRKKYVHIRLRNRAGGAFHPTTTIIDLRAQKMIGAFSSAILNAVSTELEQGHQILLFLNKRGYSPVIMCHNCGWTGKCKRCNVHFTYHKHEHKLACHHCGAQAKTPDQCPECSADGLLQVGYGTERLSETLAEVFPKARILRIDRDSTRRKGAMGKMVDVIKRGDADILIGTQMLAKGHDFPNLNMVGIIDADRGLFSTDFRASEHMAQLIVQVSGRAGRTSDKGRVFIQTHYPEHPLLQTLVETGYQTFARKVLEERKQAELPPYSHQVLLRSDDYRKETNEKFLNDAKSMLGKITGIEIYGPFPAPLEQRAGRLRYQLLLQSSERNLLLNAITPWALALESTPSGKKVRWSIDVDPLDNI